MRVIGGEFRSRVLKSLPGMDVRPTPDRLREALFSILTPRISGSLFVDLYAGTGAVGIEALSRGAARAVFVENNSDAAAVIRLNLKSLELESRARVWLGRANSVIPKMETADIVFLDPPYPLEHEYERALIALADEPPGLVIAQHASRFALQAQYGVLKKTRTVKHGDNSLSFYVSSDLGLDRLDASVVHQPLDGFLDRG